MIYKLVHINLIFGYQPFFKIIPLLRLTIILKYLIIFLKIHRIEYPKTKIRNY